MEGKDSFMVIKIKAAVDVTLPFQSAVHFKYKYTRPSVIQSSVFAPQIKTTSKWK